MTLPRRSIWPAPSRRSIWPGRYGAGSGVAVDPLTISEFYAPLTHSLTLTRGTGSATYTRATTAWEFDNEGKLVTVPSGIPRFGGARFNGTDTWYNTDSGGSPISAASLLGFHAEGARTNSLLYSRDLRATPNKWIPSTGSTEVITNGAFASDTTGFLATGSASISWDASASALVDITGSAGGIQTDQTFSLTVGKTYLLCADIKAGTYAGKVNLNYNGATETQHTVTGSYVTVKHAFVASVANPGFKVTRAAASTGTIYVDNISVKEAAIQVTTCTGIDNAANSASTLTAGADNATILQTITASGARSSSAYVKRRTGTGKIIFTRNSIDTLRGAGDFSASFGNLTNCTISGGKLNVSTSTTWSSFGPTPVVGKTYRLTYTIDSITPGSSNIRFYIGSQAGEGRTAPGTYTEDITYTSGAALFYLFTGGGFVAGVVDNLTIRCISDELDITSLINSSTWTRVKIENTSVTNPSVGFLIATSGDSIDVDVVQDEAGAFASSPIVTTTAAVTRNADALSYATASNWSDTAGAARASVQYDVWANASGTAIGGTNGLVLSTSNSGVQAKDGTNTVNGPTGTPSGTELLAMGWGSGALKAASGGTLGTAGSYDGAFGLSTIAIGAPAGYIKDAYVWQSALTDAQLQTVTS